MSATTKKMEKSKRKRKKILITLIAFVALASVLVFGYLQRGKTGSYTEETVRRGSIETTFSFAGNVESENTAGIMAEKTMQIAEIAVKEGEKVKKDAVLFKTSLDEEVKAKIDGEVVDITVEEGESVMGGTRLCDLVDFDNLQITIKVDEYDLPSIEVGKTVNVAIGALDKDITGTVSSISRTAVTQNSVSYFTATIDLQNDAAIKVGMSAEAKILNKKADDVLILSMNALRFDEENKPYVLLKSDKGAPVSKKVSVGINDGLNVEITEGLSEGQVVLVSKSSASQADFRALR